MPASRKKGIKTTDANIDSYFKHTKSTPVKRKTVHDENTPPATLTSSPKKRQFGGLKTNLELNNKQKIQLPLRDKKNFQPKPTYPLGKINDKPSFAVADDRDIKKEVETQRKRTHSLVKSKPVTEDKATTKDEQTVKDNSPPTETKPVLPKQEEKSQDKEKESSDDSDDDLFTKTTNSSVTFKPLTLETASLELEKHTSPQSRENSHPPSSPERLFVDPDLEFSLSEISSLPKNDKHSKKLIKAQEELNKSKDKITQETETEGEGDTLASLEPESIDRVIIPYPNPRGRNVLEKLGVQEDGDD